MTLFILLLWKFQETCQAGTRCLWQTELVFLGHQYSYSAPEQTVPLIPFRYSYINTVFPQFVPLEAVVVQPASNPVSTHGSATGSTQ